MNNLSMPKTQSLIDNLEANLDWYGYTSRNNSHIYEQMVMFSWMMEQISNSKNLMTYAGFAFILVFLLLVYRKFPLSLWFRL